MTNTTEDPELPRRSELLRAMDIAVDFGFAVLLLISGVRYFAYHPFSDGGPLILTLAIGAGVSYAIGVLGHKHQSSTGGPRLSAVRSRQGIGLLLATAFWLPLTVIAPSFAWCAFALFFAVNRVLSGRVAAILSGTMVVAVSTGLLVMSRGQDLGLVLGPFFGGLVLAYAYSHLDQALKAQQELISQLVETRSQLAQSEREAGALAERGRVASELHDTVVQRTAGALILLESEGLSDYDTPLAVAEARDELRSALVETRQLLAGLDLPRDSSSYLAETLDSVATEAGASFVISGSTRAVPDLVSHALQRITREALINTRKHTSATDVRVTLSFFPDAVGVDIADNGEGFDPASLNDINQESGFGIRAMKWRTNSLGGELSVESHPGHGTVVAAIVPLTNSVEE